MGDAICYKYMRLVQENQASSGEFGIAYDYEYVDLLPGSERAEAMNTALCDIGRAYSTI